MAQQQLSTNTFGTAKWIVSATASDGTHTTIAAALTSASSGDTIFIRPGTYTENLTLKAGVNLTAYVCDAFTPNVTISGKCTFTAAGTVSISGINLQTNSDFALAVTGSSASIVYLNNCYINASNNTAISYTSSSSSSAIYITYCQGNLATTGIGYWTASSAGTLRVMYCNLNNTGGSTTASTTSATPIDLFYCRIQAPLSSSSTGQINITNCNINTGAQNTTPVTIGGTTASVFANSGFFGGTASAISVSSGATLSLYQNCQVDSSNTNAITGAGTINYGVVVYTGSSKLDNVTTQTSIPTNVGYVLIQTQTASNSASISFTNLGTFKNLMLVYSCLPVSTNTNLLVQYSTNGGSSYANSGYRTGIQFISGAVVNNSNTATTAAIIGRAILNGPPNVGNVTFYDVNTPTIATTYAVTGSCSDTSSTFMVVGSGNMGNGTTTINALQITFSSGNISSGIFSLYGMNN